MQNKMKRTIAQTPAPKSDRVKGSKVNKSGSATAKGASNIKLSDKTINTLKGKLEEFKKGNPKNTTVTLDDLKAVYRRGSGAYSTSHRPTITGGAPNTRAAWSFARVNKFLKKASGEKVKAAYVQDDDLFKYEDGGKTFNDKELLARWKKGESIGFTAIAHLKAKGLIPRADGDKKVSEKYMEQGGGIDETITCMNCGWHWKESETEEFDMYVCHKCGFDNAPFYEKKQIALPDTYTTYGVLKDVLSEQGYDISKEDIMSKLKKPKTLIEISEIHGVDMDVLRSQLEKGVKAEMEHTTDENIARTIALHHIEEISNYYDMLEKMEMGAKNEMADGGVVVGKRHSESDEFGTGERFTVKSTGQVVEVEGGEGVLCKESMESSRLFHFDGKKMTGREIASILNHKYGGVEFAKGGKVNDCGCDSIKFKHGGELPSATLEGLEGGEAVVTVKTMESKDEYNFNGGKSTPRKILSVINAASGGKKFENGGTIDISKHKIENLNKLAQMVYFTENMLYYK